MVLERETIQFVYKLIGLRKKLVYESLKIFKKKNVLQNGQIFKKIIIPSHFNHKKIKQKKAKQYLTRKTGTWVQNPAPSEASYIPKQRNYWITKLYE